jgi:hypothetical protein
MLDKLDKLDADEVFLTESKFKSRYWMLDAG